MPMNLPNGPLSTPTQSSNSGRKHFVIGFGIVLHVQRQNVHIPRVASGATNLLQRLPHPATGLPSKDRIVEIEHGDASSSQNAELMNVLDVFVGTFCGKRQELPYRIQSQSQTVTCRLSNSSVGGDPENPLFIRLHGSPIANRNHLLRMDSVLMCDFSRIRILNSSLHDPGSPDQWQPSNLDASWRIQISIS